MSFDLKQLPSGNGIGGGGVVAIVAPRGVGRSTLAAWILSQCPNFCNAQGMLLVNDTPSQSRAFIPASCVYDVNEMGTQQRLKQCIDHTNDEAGCTLTDLVRFDDHKALLLNELTSVLHPVIKIPPLIECIYQFCIPYVAPRWCIIEDPGSFRLFRKRAELLHRALCEAQLRNVLCIYTEQYYTDIPKPVQDEKLGWLMMSSLAMNRRVNDPRFLPMQQQQLPPHSFIIMNRANLTEPATTICVPHDFARPNKIIYHAGDCLVENHQDKQLTVA